MKLGHKLGHNFGHKFKNKLGQISNKNWGKPFKKLGQTYEKKWGKSIQKLGQTSRKIGANRYRNWATTNHHWGGRRDFRLAPIFVTAPISVSPRLSNQNYTQQQFQIGCLSTQKNTSQQLQFRLHPAWASKIYWGASIRPPSKGSPYPKIHNVTSDFGLPIFKNPLFYIRFRAPHILRTLISRQISGSLHRTNTPPQYMRSNNPHFFVQ